ncbi:bifunctional transcriptional activator/DNA repair enzyme AdaA [Streptomyces spiramenti]|uniref:Helix-turn-helix domain-containing protein n=1 Tax=Streptomyces spiramenti TaxID=2720606 RepID=A0ABX1AEC3_9ACTN|nr:Ada metal-binding domain-containing protein [Streptomyces spiramenti]NJP65489.1 helix-turn-helix domain-containing protein [Streptomyces spiramenti]
MAGAATYARDVTRNYTSDEERWQALRDNDRDADGHFYYAVRTTGLYSRPSCVLRPARREDVTFLSTTQEARAGGYRSCRRCRPDAPDPDRLHALAVARACRLMDESAAPLSLQELAHTAGYSRFHFHRMFKTLTGVTPHAYLSGVRAHRVRHELAHARTVSDAIYSAGFSSNGRFYAASPTILGMTPQEFRSGGPGVTIRHTVASSSLGPVLVAATDKGVCAVLPAASDTPGLRTLAGMFPLARLTAGDSGFATRVRAVVRRAEPPAPGRELLPTDLLTVCLHTRVRQGLSAPDPAPRERPEE